MINLLSRTVNIFVLLGGETNDTQGGKKHGGRRNATEKQQVMLEETPAAAVQSAVRRFHLVK